MPAPAPVDPGNLKVGTASASLEKYIFDYRYIERLETDSVAGDRVMEKRRLNPDGDSARETGSKKEMTWGNQSFRKLIQFLYFGVCLHTFCYA